MSALDMTPQGLMKAARELHEAMSRSEAEAWEMLGQYDRLESQALAYVFAMLVDAFDQALVQVAEDRGDSHQESIREMLWNGIEQSMKKGTSDLNA